MNDMQKKPTGRPKHLATDQNRKIIAHLLSSGLPHANVAKVMSMGIHTLRREYGDLLADTKQDKAIQILDTLYDKAIIEGSVPCLIFLAKTVLGLRETPSVDEQIVESRAIQNINITLAEVPKKEEKVIDAEVID